MIVKFRSTNLYGKKFEEFLDKDLVSFYINIYSNHLTTISCTIIFNDLVFIKFRNG